MRLSIIPVVSIVYYLVSLCAGRIVTSSDGIKIYANAIGNPSNPSLVFVHGFALSGIVFDDILRDARLLSRFYMVAYDLRGHGRSDKPSNADSYTSKLFADDFAAVSHSFKLKSPAPVLVAWSYGGTVFSDIFSNLPPNSVSALVSVAALPHTGLEGVNTPSSLSFLSGLFNGDDVPTNINAKVALVDACFNDPSTVPIETKWSWLGSMAIQFPAVSSILLARSQDPSALFEAGAQGLPLLMLAGTNDKVVLNDAVINDTAPHFTNVQVHRVQGGSHALFFDEKDEFIRLLVSFITSLRH